MAQAPLVDAVEASIKVDLAFGLAQRIDAAAVRSVWTAYINRASAKKRGYDLLIKDLNACLEGSKILTYTPDGVPAFLDAKGA